MQKRIVNENGLCPVIKLTECSYPDGALVDQYRGAGVALIACKDNSIEEMEYLTEDPWSNLEFCMKHHSLGHRLFIGMCSCVELCEPQELHSGTEFSMPSLIDQMEDHMRKNKLTMVH